MTVAQPVVPRVVRGCDLHGADCVVLRVHPRGDADQLQAGV